MSTIEDHQRTEQDMETRQGEPFYFYREIREKTRERFNSELAVVVVIEDGKIRDQWKQGRKKRKWEYNFNKSTSEIKDGMKKKSEDLLEIFFSMKMKTGESRYAKSLRVFVKA